MSGDCVVNTDRSNQLPSVERVVSDIHTKMGDSLMNVIYAAIMGIHYYSASDQEMIMAAINENILRLDGNDRLWVAKVFKNSYLSLDSLALNQYFRLLYTIEDSLDDGNYDIKLLAELIEQFGRLFKVYPAQERTNVVRIFQKYVLSKAKELILASCESIEMVIHGLEDSDKEGLVSSLNKARKGELDISIQRTLESLLSRLSNSPYLLANRDDSWEGSTA